jgi:hypothetical protein
MERRAMSLERFEHSIVSPALLNVARHWADARGGRRMPGWSDLKPAAIKDQLAFIWSWRFDSATGEFVGRLAGERIENIFGMSIRGKSMREAFAGYDYEKIYARHVRVATEPALYRGSGLIFRHFERFDVGERIIMPLAEDGEHPDGIVGATEFQSNFGPPSDEALHGPEIAEWFTLD